MLDHLGQEDLRLRLASSLARYAAPVDPAWIDDNGHMSVEAYSVLLRQVLGSALEEWGYGASYRKATGHGTFVVQTHSTYHRELKLGQVVLVTTRILGLDDKRVHVMSEFWNGEEGYRAAIMEYLTLNVSRSPAPRASPIEADARRKLHRFALEQAGVPVPADWRSGIRFKPSADVI